MRKALLGVALIGLLAAPLAAQDARAEMTEVFEMNQKAMHELVHGLSDAQWNFKPAEDRWSILEIVEHITINEDMVNQLVHGGLSDIEANPEGSSMMESQLTSTLQDRSQTFQAPAEMQPTGRYESGEEAMAAFDKARGGMIHFFGMASWDLHSKGAQHPMLGMEMDAKVWSVMTVEHAKRHMKQIKEVMEADGYPSM